MKRADLVVGEAYAYAQGRDPSFARRVVLVSAELHARGRHDGISPANAGAKPGRGSGYFGTTVGWLVRDDEGRESLAQPAELRMTWADWLVHKAKRDAADKAQRESDAKLRAQREEKTRAVAAALDGSPWAGRVVVTRYQQAQSVPNDVLLEMLSAALGDAR